MQATRRREQYVRWIGGSAAALIGLMPLTLATENDAAEGAAYVVLAAAVTGTFAIRGRDRGTYRAWCAAAALLVVLYGVVQGVGALAGEAAAETGDDTRGLDAAVPLGLALAVCGIAILVSLPVRKPAATASAAAATLLLVVANALYVAVGIPGAAGDSYGFALIPAVPLAVALWRAQTARRTRR